MAELSLEERVAKLEDVAHPPIDMAELIGAGQIGELTKQLTRIADFLEGHGGDLENAAERAGQAFSLGMRGR